MDRAWWAVATLIFVQRIMTRKRIRIRCWCLALAVVLDIVCSNIHRSITRIASFTVSCPIVAILSAMTIRGLTVVIIIIRPPRLLAAWAPAHP